MCLQNNLLKRRSIGYVILNKFKQVPLCKSVQVRTSANAFVGIANRIIKRRSKVHQKVYHVNELNSFNNENDYLKTVSQLDYGLFTKLLRIILTYDFSPRSFILKTGVPSPLSK